MGFGKRPITNIRKWHSLLLTLFSYKGFSLGGCAVLCLALRLLTSGLRSIPEPHESRPFMTFWDDQSCIIFAVSFVPDSSVMHWTSKGRFRKIPNNLKVKTVQPNVRIIYASQRPRRLLSCMHQLICKSPRIDTKLYLEVANAICNSYNQRWAG